MTHRRHRLGPYRRHDRRAVGQGRPPGAVLRRAIPRSSRAWWRASAAWRRPARSSRRSRSATSMFIAVPYGALPQIGQDYGAALKGKIVLDACNASAARDGADRRGGREERHRRDLAEISARHAARARLQHDELHDLRARGEPPRSEAGDPDRRRRCRGGAKSRPGSCATPASIRWSSASSPMPSRFQRGAPGYGQQVTAAELRQKLSLAP